MDDDKFKVAMSKLNNTRTTNTINLIKNFGDTITAT